MKMYDVSPFNRKQVVKWYDKPEDGSDYNFDGMEFFKNKKVLAKFLKELESNGYVMRPWNTYQNYTIQN